jgi:hypothetical protein
MVDKSTAPVSSFFPNTTKTLPKVKVVDRSPQQAMSMAMAWMI